MKSRLLSALLLSLSGGLYAQPVANLVLDACPNSCGTFSQNFFTSGGKVFYSANVPDNNLGAELWITDGTPGGTKMIKDVNPSPTFGTGTESSDPTGFAELNGKVYFAAIDDPTFEYKLYVTDGTSDGTKSISTTPVRFMPTVFPATTPTKVFYAYKSKLYYNAMGTFGVTELWGTDGSTAGTTMVKAFTSFDAAHDFVTLNDKMYFIVDDQGLMESDGTDAGTKVVKAMNCSNLTVYNNKLYFTGLDGNGSELWTSDGTDAGTVLFKDINPGGSSAMPRNLMVHNGKMYFTTSSELWSLDSMGNSAMIKKFANPIPYRMVNSNTLMVSNNKLYFAVEHMTSGNTFLAVSDGTSAGTTVVTTKVQITNLVTIPFNNKLYFAGFIPSTGTTTLCYTDGTDAGTKAVWPNLMVGNMNMHAAATNHDLYISADDMDASEEVWKITEFNTGVNEVRNMDIAIYPNPATSVLNIETGNSGNTTIRIMSITGQTMLQQEISTAKATVEISQLPAGTYFMHMTSKGATKVEKFVKQ